MNGNNSKMKITAHWQIRVDDGPDVIVPITHSSGAASKKGKINMAKIARIAATAQSIAGRGNIVELILFIQPAPSTEPQTP